MRTDRQKDIEKLIVVFRKFEKVPKMQRLLMLHKVVYINTTCLRNLYFDSRNEN